MMSRRFLLLLLLTVFVCEPMLLSQIKPIARLSGKVVDAETGEEIIGANIVVEGTTRGCASDIEGKYSITLDPGTYSIFVSALSYTRKRITELNLEAGKELTLYISLQSDAIKTQEVIIEGKANTSYEAVLLTKQKNASMISDGLSAEQVKRSPDATSGDALRRLTGITLVDNKFIFVRGVTDRYNQTTLNGATVSSTESDKRGFSFDLLPSSLLENTVIIKSATPDMRGDFTGGLVQLNTLDFPDRQVIKISPAASVNTLTTGNSFGGVAGGGHDWTGMDDGSRSLPGGVSNTNALARQLPNTWGVLGGTAPLSRSLSISYGDKFMLNAEGEVPQELGFVGALTYRNGYQHNDRLINDVEGSRYLTGSRDDQSVLWGIIANLSYKFSGGKLSFKNTYNQSGEEQVGQYAGRDWKNNPERRTLTSIEWNQRSMYSGQLSGEHILDVLGGSMLEWRGSISNSDREVPDRKEATYYGSEDFPDDPMTVATNRRMWSALNDHMKSASMDLTIPVSSSLKVKTGILAESKDTDYRIRVFQIIPEWSNGLTNDVASASLSSVYDPAHFANGYFSMKEDTHADDSYIGLSSLYAAYVMADAPFHVFDEQFRFVGGLRMENARESVKIPKSLSADGPVSTEELHDVDIIPSVNLTYSANAITNLRFAYSHSVNRPEFREISTTSFFDFVKYELIAGNPSLQRSLARNVDLRLELFPDVGEILAVSYFHKSIDNAIEERLIQTANRTRTWVNSPEAVNQGWEFEVRKSLGFFGEFWKRFSISANYTIIKSEVVAKRDTGNSTLTGVESFVRPMQGQSPYTANASFVYAEPTIGTTVSILYNKFGRRLDAVGFLAADVYEEPREMVDISISQPIIGGLDAKLTVKNLNNSSRVLSRSDVLYERISTGRTFTFQINQTF